MTTPKDCVRFVALQDRQLAEEESLSAKDEAFLAEHGSRCPSCGLEAATLSALRLAEDLSPDPALTDSVVLQRVERIIAARSQPQRAWRPGRNWRLGLAASAAAALAMLLVAQPWKSGVAPVASPGAGNTRQVHLTLISGEVNIARRSAAVNQRLVAGERLSVGSGRAVITFADGSNVTLQARSQLEIVSARSHGVHIRLLAGEAIFKVAPQRSGRHFDVSTTWGKVRVVGTVFMVSHARPERVRVARGEVRVKTNNATATSLTGGMMLLANREVREVSSQMRRTLLRAADSASRLVAQEPAILSVNTTEPGATVALDGEVIGTTPIELCLRPGAHRVDVSRHGFTTLSRTVELAVGKRASVNLALVAQVVSPGTVPTDQQAQRIPPKSAATAGAGRHMARLSAPASSDSDGRPVPSPDKAAIPAPTLEAPTVGQLLRHAAHYRASSNWKEMVRVYRQLIRLHPNTPEAASSLLLVGQELLRHLGKPRAALRYFNSYLKHHSGGVLAQEAAWGRINCLRRLGQKHEEIRACRDLLKRHPSSVYAKRIRARLTLLTGASK